MGNRIFFNLLFFIWCFSLFTCTTASQDTTTDRGFDQAHLENLNKLESYNYNRDFEGETGDNPALNLLGRIISGIAWFFNSMLGYLIIAILIGLLIWILVKNSNRFFEKKKLQEKEKLITVETMEIGDKDYNRLIQAALKKQDYRMAIRFGFISALKYLHKNSLIEWKMDKTNLDYQFELPENFQELFAGMSMIYERIWYGNFTANKELFNMMSHKFHELKNRQNL